MAQWLSERLGQQFIIENKPGAGNNIGTEAVVNAPPDGYTLLLVNPANAINATLYRKLQFNFLQDIAPVAGIMRVPNVMVVNPSVPAKTFPSSSPMPRPIRARSTGRPRATARRCISRRAVQDDDRRRHGARAVSRLGAGAHRPDERHRAGDLRQHAALDAAHPRQAARAGGDDDGAILDALPDVPTVARLRPGYEASAFYGMGVPRHAARDHRQAQQGGQRRARRPQDQGPPRRTRRHATIGTRSGVRNSSPTRPTNGRR